MRCYQEIGLMPEAFKFLDENVLKTGCRPCPHCGKPTAEEWIVIDTKHIDMFYGDGPTLRTFILKDGSKVKEIVQAEPWSSGPCAFLCLEREDGSRMFEWPQEEIDKA